MMRKIIVVAVREYQAAVKTKAFIISILAMPVFMGGGIVVQTLMRDKVDTTDRRIAVVDQTGRLYDAVVEEALKRNESDVFKGEGEDRKKIRPRFLIERAEVGSDDPARMAFDLSERVRNEQIFAFLIVGPDVVKPGDDPGRARVAYHSNTPTYDDFKNWVAGVLNRHTQQLRFQAVDLEPEVVQQATQRVP
ncbi:MAG: hypothetical protein JSU86_06730, partial [Phycisphaerales bacterium]